MVTDLESLCVTVNETKRFCTSSLCILERRGILVCPVTSCSQNAFLQKHTAEKEELNHRLEYIYSADRHLL